MNINERIKKIRKELDLTLEKFGERIGIKKSTMSSIENGRNNVTDQMFKSICREFNVNEEWLHTGKGEMFNEINKENEIFKWVDNVLKNRPDNFKKRFLAILTTLSENEWIFLEEKAKELVLYEKESPQSSENTYTEISSTKETDEIPPEYENMSVEEIEKQADFWDSLYEKRQEEIELQKQDGSLQTKDQKNNKVS